MDFTVSRTAIQITITLEYKHRFREIIAPRKVNKSEYLEDSLTIGGIVAICWRGMPHCIQIEKGGFYF